jgi:glycosyltransferase involved in cell wall biosynthesis
LKLLYIAALPIDFKNLDGVPKKIISQCKALSRDFAVDLIFYHGGQVRLREIAAGGEKLLGKAASKLDVLRTAGDLVEKGGYGCMYIRYPRSDYLFLRLLKKAKKQGIRIAMEIPTYPYDMEGHETLKGRIINGMDRHFRKYLHRYVDRIVTYSDDREIFGVPTINTINGVDFDVVKADETPVDTARQIQLVAVSAMYRVHGYDRLIRGMHEYYQKGCTRDILLKLVGKGDAYGDYQRLVEAFGLQAHVEFCGVCFGDALEEAYRGSALGVNSLAIHRQGLEKESTLKTKEYAAKGLPVLSSSYVDAFSSEGNTRFALRVPPDETPVDVVALVDFVDRVYSGGTTAEIRREIREDGRNTCDVHTTMRCVADYLLGE